MPQYIQLMPNQSTDRSVLVITRDLFFRAKLEAVIREAGYQPLRQGEAGIAVIELEGDQTLERIRTLAGSGVKVLAHGSHVRAELLRSARQAGAEAVPNSRVESVLKEMLRLRDE